MASDPGIEVVVVSPLTNDNRSEDENRNTPNAEVAAPQIPGSAVEDKKEEEDRSDSVTAYSSPKSGTVDLDTSKVHVKTSDLEARAVGTDPEAVRYSVGLEHVSNIEILNARQPPAWLTKRRWFILGCGIILLLIVAIIVIGLVAGLVLARRSGDGGSSSETSSTAALSACGTHPAPIHRQLLSATQLKGDVYIFARGLDGDIWFRVLSGTDSSWKGEWARWIPTGDTFVGPPTAISWNPNGDDRLHVFAPANNGKYNVLAAGYLNGTFPNTWQNLGESAATPVSLCRMPSGWASSQAGAPDRIDQWVVNRESRGIFHDFWNWAIENFQEPATYADWESSPSVQASASTLAMICRKEDPIHTLVMYANGTDSVRFRHYTGSNRVWNSWVDIGGNFIGDPVVLPVTGMLFHFFGINATGMMQSFSWTDATGLGYRPAWVPLNGSFSSMPSAVVSSIEPVLKLDVVALGTDGVLKHKAFRNTSWEIGQWEDLGVEANSAPLLFQYEVDSDRGRLNKTMLAAIGTDNQLRVATWESASDKPWRELVAGTWMTAGGNLTTKSMCD